MLFIQVVNFDEPHYTGLIYSVQEFDTDYYKVITEICFKNIGEINESIRGKNVCIELISKRIATPILIDFSTHEEYFKQMIDRTLKLEAIIMEMPESCFEVVKYF